MIRRNCLIRQVNNFTCQFSMIDAPLRNMLFKTYCNSHYGSELWDVTSNKIEDYCIAWRKSVRRIWRLPNTTSRTNVCLIAGCIPMFDEICRRFLNFIHSCLVSSSALIQFIASHGIHSGMFSPLGRNVQLCSHRYGIDVTSIG